jgi:hypothetical protein
MGLPLFVKIAGKTKQIRSVLNATLPAVTLC